MNDVYGLGELLLAKGHVKKYTEEFQVALTELEDAFNRCKEAEAIFTSNTDLHWPPSNFEEYLNAQLKVYGLNRNKE